MRKRVKSLGDHFEAVLPYYRVYSEGRKYRGNYVFECKGCDRVWSLPKDNRHPGNVLALLDHGVEHSQANRLELAPSGEVAEGCLYEVGCTEPLKGPGWIVCERHFEERKADRAAGRLI